MESALGQLLTWVKENSVRINAENTELISFTRRNKIPEFWLRKMDSETVEAGQTPWRNIVLKSLEETHSWGQDEEGPLCVHSMRAKGPNMTSQIAYDTLDVHGGGHLLVWWKFAATKTHLFSGQGSKVWEFRSAMSSSTANGSGTMLNLPGRP